MRSIHICLVIGLVYAFFCLTTTDAYSQDYLFRKPNHYSVELGAYLSSSTQTPFWLRSNQYGIVSNRSSSATLRFVLQSDYDTSRHSNGRWRTSKYDFGYGFNLVANATQYQLPYERHVLLPEAYVKVRRGIFEAYVGRQREKFGLADSSLSTGSYSWSGNAMPIPKLQISIPNFTPIGFTKGWLSVQGTYAHGYMDANGYIKNSMLHQKSLYLRIGKPQAVLKIYGGFNHQVVWGGRIADPANVPTTIQSDGKLPSSLRDYFYVVTGSYPSQRDTNQYNYFDLTNRVGNHLGSIDVAFEVDLVRNTLYFYRQSLYEDGSLFYLINIADGLNGVRIRRNNPNAVVRDILFEFLNTTSQGGPEFIIDDPGKRGKDDYFNHQQFRDGWAYRQHTIGTPFIPPALGPQDQYPQGTFTNNNRVYVFHLGLAGSLPLEFRGLLRPITYQVKISFSRNFGTYNQPFESTHNQFSTLASVVAPLSIIGGIQLTASLATDSGLLYQNGIGTYLSIKKVWKNNNQ